MVFCQSDQPFLGEVVEIEELTAAILQAQAEKAIQHYTNPNPNIGLVNERINQQNSELNRFIITPEELQYTGAWSALKDSQVIAWKG